MRHSMHHIAIAVVAAGLIAACADSEQEKGPAVEGVIAASPEQNKLQEILDRGSLRVGTTGDFYMSWKDCLLYTSPSPRDVEESRMPSSA